MSALRNLVLPPDDDPLDPSWTTPLEAVERAIRGIRRYRFFELGDDTELGAVGRYRLECQQWDRDHWMDDGHWREDAPWPEGEV